MIDFHESSSDPEIELDIREEHKNEDDEEISYTSGEMSIHDSANDPEPFKLEDHSNHFQRHWGNSFYYHFICHLFLH